MPYAGYAICDNFSIIENATLPPSCSAQVDKSYTLMIACQLAEGNKHYSHSTCAFGCLHECGMLWANQGFITSSGIPIKYSKFVGKLLEACHLPTSITVVKCEAHT